MRDIQNSPDTRNIPLTKVGVKNVKYPITVLDKENRTQHTVANIHLFADLPHQFKGTHMSRFIEVFHKHHTKIDMKNFLVMLEEIRKVLHAQDAYAELSFPYFVKKRAPVSNQDSYMEYQAQFIGEAFAEKTRFFVELNVPVMTLCPCSKEISDRGAHNQRGFAKVRVLMGQEFFWMEDLISLIESSASSGLYTILKREDEKFVTEYSYDHPVFVEDLVRSITEKLEAWGIFSWFRVEAENMESIHNHEAYAMVERGSL